MKTNTDPIFAAIAAHRAAADAYCAASNTDKYNEVLVKKLGTANKTALKKLLTSPPPTTLLGVAALLDHLAQPDVGHDSEDAVLAGAIGWEGEIKAAAMKLPAVLAETMRGLIGGRP